MSTLSDQLHQSILRRLHRGKEVTLTTSYNNYNVTSLGAMTHVDYRELLKYSSEFLVERILRELDLAHVEITDAADLEVFVDNLQAAP